MNLAESPLCSLLGVQYPILQAGMVWVSGAKLAAASANAGILGVVGAGSMKPDLLKEHLVKAKSLTKKPFAVNVPLLYKKSEEQIETALAEGVSIFITSAGSPKVYTSYLKQKGCFVIHVVSNPKFAIKCEEAGVDAIVAEGFEAGGHNGLDEITTFCLLPEVRAAVKIPVIAAGGIATGEQMLAARCLGADAFQIGTRFVATKESSAHENFKKVILSSSYGSTQLCMKKLTPVRLLKNNFYDKVSALEESGAGKSELMNCLGKGRAKLGILEGDLEEGELEIGQVCSMIKDIPSVADCVKELIQSYEASLKKLRS